MVSLLTLSRVSEMRQVFTTLVFEPGTCFIVRSDRMEMLTCLYLGKAAAGGLKPQAEMWAYQLESHQVQALCVCRE